MSDSRTTLRDIEFMSLRCPCCGSPYVSNENAVKHNFCKAAPELYSALKELLALSMPERATVRPHEDCGCFSCRIYNAFESAQIALAKAEGGDR